MILRPGEQFFYEKSNLLINLLLDLSEGVFDSTDRRGMKFCVYGLILRFFGAGKWYFMPFLYLFMLGSHWASGPAGRLSGHQ